MKKRMRILPLVFILGWAPLIRVAQANPKLTKLEDNRPAISEPAPVAVAVVQVQQPAQEDAQTAKVRAEVAKRVAQKKTRVKVRLRSGGEVKGKIDQAESEGFSLTEDKTRKKLDLSYTAVEKVSGQGMSTKKVLLIAGGVVVAIIVTLAVIVAVDVADGGLIDDF